MNKVYSLLDYQLIVKMPDRWQNLLSTTDFNQGLVLGGSGSMLETFSFKLNETTFTTKGDVTGGYVHHFSGNRTGEISMSINQESRSSKIMYQLSNMYHQKTDSQGSYNNLIAFPTITLTNISSGDKVVEASSCVITKPVDKKIAGETDNLEWTFSCGEVIIFQ